MTPPTIALVLLAGDLEAPDTMEFPVESADEEGVEEADADETDVDEIDNDAGDVEVAGGVAVVGMEELDVVLVPDGVVNAANKWSVTADDAQAI